jgi:hypothetical protein
MRVLLLLVFVAAFALPASAGRVDPKALVLQRADLPTGYVLDRDESGLRANASESQDGPESRRLVARSGRLTGYEISWDKGEVTLESRADLCRRPSGARILFDFVVAEMKKVGIRGLRRAPAGVGAESWIYWGGTPAAFTLVVWRYDRVFAGIVGVGLSKSLALKLARSQQHRIGDALRKPFEALPGTPNRAH